MHAHTPTHPPSPTHSPISRPTPTHTKGGRANLHCVKMCKNVRIDCFGILNKSTWWVQIICPGNFTQFCTRQVLVFFEKSINCWQKIFKILPYFQKWTIQKALTYKYCAIIMNKRCEKTNFQPHFSRWKLFFFTKDDPQFNARLFIFFVKIPKFRKFGRIPKNFNKMKKFQIVFFWQMLNFTPNHRTIETIDHQSNSFGVFFKYWIIFISIILAQVFCQFRFSVNKNLCDWKMKSPNLNSNLNCVLIENARAAIGLTPLFVVWNPIYVFFQTESCGTSLNTGEL